MKSSIKKIVVDMTPVLPGGENGGAKIFVLELLKILAAERQDTNFVLLTQFSSHEELSRLQSKNVQCVMVIGPPSPYSLKRKIGRMALSAASRLPGRLKNPLLGLGYKASEFLRRNKTNSLLKNMGADLLFCPFTAPIFFDPEVPAVCTIYDLQYKTYPEFFTHDDVVLRDRNFTSAVRCATAFAAISDYSRDSAITYGPISPERIRTIYLRMSRRLDAEKASSTGVTGRLGLTDGRYFIFPANFWKHKNHEMLLTAFNIACSKGLADDLKLVCTGAPGDRQRFLAEAARNMNLGERVRFPGFLPDAELSELVSKSLGVVFPSLYEGFGLPVIEAMAAGVPVACSNTTSLPEVADGAAILFNPRIPDEIAAALLELANNEELRSRLVGLGKARAEYFSDSSVMAQEYWELFQYAVNAGKHKDLAVGVYPDGWATPQVTICVRPDGQSRTLELEVFAPPALPYSSLNMSVWRDGMQVGETLSVRRGHDASFSMPISADGGAYVARFSAFFVPAISSATDDKRKLSLMIKKCGIRTERDGFTSLVDIEGAS